MISEIEEFLNFLLIVCDGVVVRIGTLFVLSFLSYFIPIEVRILFVSFLLETLLEEGLAVIVIRLFIKTKVSAVCQIFYKFIRETLTENFNRGREFLFHNAFVFIFFVVCFKILPGERTSKEVHKNVTKGFQIISSALFDT